MSSASDPSLHFPVLVFDGDCAFCRMWIAYWRDLTGERVAYEPYQKVAEQFPDIPMERFKKALQLITPAGEVFSAAHAVFRALAYAPHHGSMLWAYEKIPGMAWISEWFYGMVAAHRNLAYWVTRVLWGTSVQPRTYRMVSWLFLKVLACIYCIAFTSFGVQVMGLIGSHGILPAADFLRAIHTYYPQTAYWQVPTLFWLNAGDLCLKFVCIIGAILSLFLLAGIAPKIILSLLFVLYLSLVSAGQDFMSFQWDVLLLEAGFLAIFLNSSPFRIWLFRWFLFRLMLLSGAVKLMSGDPTWHNLTALHYHYETQPLPTPVAWYMHLLSRWFSNASVVFLFFVELVAAFFIFAPRRLRLFAAGSMVALQASIFLTGNYTFFNLLTIALCVFLVDDTFLGPFLPKRILARNIRDAAGKRRFGAIIPIAILILSGFQLIEIFWGRLPRPAATVLTWIAPFRIINTYGLFAVMTTTRPEIVMEGSNDGKHWLEYEFRYKPGDLKRAPPWVAPHQPRLDWQMWFAALGSYRENPWFENFVARLLQGSPDVLALLQKNPFAGAPPRYVRALLYDYHFTDTHAGGNWWRRELKGEYFPAASLK